MPPIYEHHSQPLLPSRLFILRALSHLGVASIMAAVALGIGVLGYHYLVGLAWLDALLNASMILGGMGPVDPISGAAGKWFASFYALFAGTVFIATASIIVTPFAHRLLHRLHIDQDESPQSS
jgi:hypothetical protein